MSGDPLVDVSLMSPEQKDGLLGGARKPSRWGWCNDNCTRKMLLSAGSILLGVTGIVVATVYNGTTSPAHIASILSGANTTVQYSWLGGPNYVLPVTGLGTFATIPVGNLLLATAFVSFALYTMILLRPLVMMALTCGERAEVKDELKRIQEEMESSVNDPALLLQRLFVGSLLFVLNAYFLGMTSDYDAFLFPAGVYLTYACAFELNHVSEQMHNTKTEHTRLTQEVASGAEEGESDLSKREQLDLVEKYNYHFVATGTLYGEIAFNVAGALLGLVLLSVATWTAFTNAIGVSTQVWTVTALLFADLVIAVVLSAHTLKNPLLLVMTDDIATETKEEAKERRDWAKTLSFGQLAWFVAISGTILLLFAQMFSSKMYAV